MKCILKDTKEFKNCLVVFVNENITKERFNELVKEDQRIDKIFNREITPIENYFLGESEMFDTRDSF